ncbi:uncharacterized protein N7484_005330 [Penicillium longicatenatum]|uniref:uncharacterized protein n=1 Tax=Penicillium longicatenatum TaxID=1561947 RepID=UPI0025497CD3|nr:uncharacterized protein N7484_005330 [Penicillium longicatenatum]KAJ5651607.1 hypothetical protein N7484_005330 [Penicillium longicatenatum]
MRWVEFEVKLVPARRELRCLSGVVCVVGARRKWIERPARHRHERDGNDMRLRARSLSIASFAEGPLLLSQAPDAQNKFLAFDVFEPHSLTQAVHALNNEGAQLPYAVDVSPSIRVYQPGSKSQVSTTSPYPLFSL